MFNSYTVAHRYNEHGHNEICYIASFPIPDMRDLLRAPIAFIISRSYRAGYPASFKLEVVDQCYAHEKRAVCQTFGVYEKNEVFDDIAKWTL